MNKMELLDWILFAFWLIFKGYDVTGEVHIVLSEELNY